ncbi:UNVERIFIED_CONTAM: Helicase protein MOM1 [Sesamum calycinum]|uniref:Helicase protein MOM1 n=1 Tax=Sesamum calycinum TaxID=2727403 RepID=A0AAW2R9B5_9LAMI
MVSDTRSSRKVKEADGNSSKKNINVRKDSPLRRSVEANVSGVRRSARETSSLRQMTPSPQGMRKSKRLDKGMPPLTPPVKRKSERLEKYSTPSSLRRSDRSKKNLSSSSSGSKQSAKELSLPESKRKKEKNLIQVTMESEKAELDPEAVGKKRKKMNARTFKALFKRQRIEEIMPVAEGPLSSLAKCENCNLIGTCVLCSKHRRIEMIMEQQLHQNLLKDPTADTYWWRSVEILKWTVVEMCVHYATKMESSWGLQRQYLVKYHGLAHIHNHWVPEKQLLLENPCLVSSFRETDQIVRWTAEWTVPDRLLGKRPIKDKVYIASSAVISVCNFEWLVKWRGLSYDHATWELDNASFLSSSLGQILMRNYEIRHHKAKQQVNQERAMTVTSFIESMNESARPFLIVTASGSLSQWEAEFAQLVPSVDVVVYNGNKDTRKGIRASEFYEEGGQVMLQVLLSSAEAVLEDQTSEYLKILSLLESNGDFDKLRGYRFETNDNLCKLKDRLSRFIAYGSTSQVSKFLEYWVPVQISNYQLEQYCATLLSNSIPLRSCSRNHPVRALHDILLTVRKLVGGPSDAAAVTKALEQRRRCEQRPGQRRGGASGEAPEREQMHRAGAARRGPADRGRKVVSAGGALVRRAASCAELLDIGIEASGKLKLLDTMLTEIKARGLRVLILFQAQASTGDILDDFLRQRFGQHTYERIDAGVILSKKQAAVNRFNKKETGQFVFLLDNRACSSVIKLSSLDIVVIYDSGWNPANDLRALQKISIDSKEFQAILSESREDTDSNAVISKVKLGVGSYSSDIPLIGEAQVQLKDGEEPHVFWKNLLDGKTPRWKHLRGPCPRNRKRVHYLDGSPRKPEIEKVDVVKKCKKLVNENLDPTLVKETQVAVSKGGPSTMGTFNQSQIPPPCMSGGRAVGAEVSAGASDERIVSSDDQKSLQAFLQGEMTRLCQILKLSEDVTCAVRKLLDYVTKNHHVNSDSTSIVQAFQISLVSFFSEDTNRYLKLE